jgi:hypothetical protein
LKFETTAYSRTKIDTIRREVKIILQIPKNSASLRSVFGKRFNEKFFNNAGSRAGDVCAKMKLFEKKINFQKSLEIPIIDYAVHALFMFSRS